MTLSQNIMYLDRKAAAKTREESYTHPETPAWLKQVAERLPEDESSRAPQELIEPTFHRKQRLFSQSKRPYEKLAWFVYFNITSRTWFEVFVMLNILLIAIATGVDLENERGQKGLVAFTNISATITLAVFTLECVLKIIAEGFEPWVYFTDRDNGNYNTFDFLIVVASFAFIDSAGSTISILRMLRLVRLLTFIKNVPQLRMIMAGLFHGVKSVSYIVMLLFLVVYMFAILAAILFGENDPAHFGSLGISIISLFQVSTLASWTSIAYVSWFGCEDYLQSPYSDENAKKIHTNFGDFQGYTCISNQALPLTTGIFFSVYILLTSWVIMSIFIGVISMGMFESFFTYQEETHIAKFIKGQAENTMPEIALSKLKKPTLKSKIELAFDDHAEEAVSRINTTSSTYQLFVKRCCDIRDHRYFLFSITLTIVLVGLISGLDTDYSLYCGRIAIKVKNQPNDDDLNVNHHLESKDSDCIHSPRYIVIVVLFAQAVFTFEALIKLFAEGLKPWHYFTDRENGSWNCIDFLIVVIGFIELTPISFIFANFPVVILRLIRLFRVFKLAKALPRLRSIVEALMSSFSSVGWVCVLICSYNYIVGCFCVVFFRENDPFHFGNVSRAMFTVLRMETLDTWDQILYITMYGCNKYPGGYEFLDNYHLSECSNSKGSGFIGFMFLLLVVLIGAYVLPTVLIGIVSIKFDKTSKHFEMLELERKDLARHLSAAKESLPAFFTDERVDLIRDVFDTLDTGNDSMLDLSEVEPFFQYVMAYLFRIELTPNNCQSLFFFVDASHSTAIGFGEFLSFVRTIKEMEVKGKEDAEYRKINFLDEILKTNVTLKKRVSQYGKDGQGKSCWDAAMDRVDQESLDAAWEAIFKSIHAAQGAELKDKVLNLFKGIDSDDSGDLECSELGEGLKSVGVRLNERQLLALVHNVDADGNGTVSLHEFVTQIQNYLEEQAELKKLQEEEEISSALTRYAHHSQKGTLHRIDSRVVQHNDVHSSIEEEKEPEKGRGILGGTSFSMKSKKKTTTTTTPNKTSHGDQKEEEEDLLSLSQKKKAVSMSAVPSSTAKKLVSSPKKTPSTPNKRSSTKTNNSNNNSPRNNDGENGDVELLVKKGNKSSSINDLEEKDERPPGSLSRSSSRPSSMREQGDSVSRPPGSLSRSVPRSASMKEQATSSNLLTKQSPNKMKANSEFSKDQLLKKLERLEKENAELKRELKEAKWEEGSKVLLKGPINAEQLKVHKESLEKLLSDPGIKRVGSAI